MKVKLFWSTRIFDLEEKINSFCEDERVTKVTIIPDQTGYVACIEYEGVAR